MSKSTAHKLTPKRRKFARLVAETGELTTAYRVAYRAGNMLPATVHSEASRTASLPPVRALIEQHLADAGLTKDAVLKIHARNMYQEEHLPTSQRAVEAAEEMLGMKQAALAPSISVAFVINRKEGVEVSPGSIDAADMRTGVVVRKDSKIIPSVSTEDGSTKPPLDDESDDNG